MRVYKILLLGLVILLSLNFVLAANVCCEKVINGGFCQNTEQSLCETGLKNVTDASKGYWAVAATSCALTSFCRPGCCFNPAEDGLCYSNYPKTLCDSKKGTFDGSDYSCSNSAQCKLGCCLIGSEASLLTEAKCKIETQKYPQLQMDFKADITDEAKCVAISKQTEKGCCAVNPNSCVYGARGACNATQTATTGFFSKKYCSELTFCNCVPNDPKLGGKGEKKDRTMCLAGSDDVYWKDSCGNPEGIAEDCDYITGSLCGDSDKDRVYTCESLNCQTSAVNPKLSFNVPNYAGSPASVVAANGVLNGESWCLYDSALQSANYGSYAPPGSRYYRSVCINGKEVTEPCADFRKQWCIDGPISVASSDARKLTFYEAGCVVNRAESCSACNSLALGGVKATDASKVKAAMYADLQCCLNSDLRDCKWVGPTATNKISNPAFGKGTFPLFCVPMSKPGFKFYAGEGADACAKANLNCEIKFRCPGTGILFGYLAGKECAGGKATTIMEKGAGKKGATWQIIYGKECLDKKWIQAANDICRSMGDCGADTNLVGRTTYAGFGNTPGIKKEFEPWSNGQKAPGFLDPIAGGPGVGNYATTVLVDFHAEDKKDKIREFFSARPDTTWIPLSISMAFGIAGGISSYTTSLNWLTGFYGQASFGRGFLAGMFGTYIPGMGKIAYGKLSPDALRIGSELTKSEVELGKLTEAANAADANVKTVFNSYSNAEKALLESNTKVAEAAKKIESMSTFDLGTPEFNKAADILNAAKADNTKLASEFTKAQSSLNDAVHLSDTANSKFSSALDSINSVKSGFNVMKIINTAMWIWTAYNLVNTFMAKEETATITTTCSPWVAPVPTVTGDICQACNNDEYVKENPLTKEKVYTNAWAFLKCSEYKCKSMGATCGIINPGTAKEKCVNLNPGDVKAPAISYWVEGTDADLNKLKSAEPPGIGIEFLNGEIPAYQRVMIGIKTDEPSQCKMSFKNSIKYDTMEPFYFGDATFEYFHTTLITYPRDVNSSNATGLKFGEPGQVYSIYVRCSDAVGNKNERDYVIKFKITKGPDITPPIIQGTSLGELPAERYLSVGSNATDITLFVDEPVSCRWNKDSDVNYDAMPLENECIALNANQNNGIYECKFAEDGKESNTIGEPLKGFNDTEFKFYYFRCKDQPACIDGKDSGGKACTRNANADAKRTLLTLRKSYYLNISEITPTGKIYIGGIGSNITLQAKTDGGAEKNGKAFCGYTTSASGKDNVWGMIAFFETNSSVHTQILSQLSTGTHTFYIGCADVAGNTVYGKTIFDLALDTNPPEITRAWVDSTSGSDVFKIRTGEKATCVYSTEKTLTFDKGNSMLTDDGITHSAQGGSTIYYVICEDQYKNRGSLVTINFLLQ